MRSNLIQTFRIEHSDGAATLFGFASGRYGSPAECSQALPLWCERAPDAWVERRNTAHTGATVISSALDGPGERLLAAPT